MRPWARFENVVIAGTTAIGALVVLLASLLGTNLALVAAAATPIALTILNYQHLEARRQNAEAPP